MVRAAKEALYAVLGRQRWTDELLVTTLTHVENVLNSRKLTPPSGVREANTQLLRHFAAHTRQKQNHLTDLLTLLKNQSEPLPDYSLLPNTGKELMKIDGVDFPASINDPTHKKLSEARIINDGKYFHFGMENAFKWESVGLIHLNANLLQFVDVYLQKTAGSLR